MKLLHLSVSFWPFLNYDRGFWFAKRNLGLKWRFRSLLIRKCKFGSFIYPPLVKSQCYSNYNISNLTHRLISAWVENWLINILIYCLKKSNLWIKRVARKNIIFSRSLGMAFLRLMYYFSSEEILPFHRRFHDSFVFFVFVFFLIFNDNFWRSEKELFLLI